MLRTAGTNKGDVLKNRLSVSVTVYGTLEKVVARPAKKEEERLDLV